jgi:hypothetical protein
MQNRGNEVDSQLRGKQSRGIDDRDHRFGPLAGAVRTIAKATLRSRGRVPIVKARGFEIAQREASACAGRLPGCS